MRIYSWIIMFLVKAIPEVIMLLFILAFDQF